MIFMRVILILVMFLIVGVSYADVVQPQVNAKPPITQPQNINFEDCTKMFGINKEKLFYLTLSAITTLSMFLQL